MQLIYAIRLVFIVILVIMKKEESIAELQVIRQEELHLSSKFDIKVIFRAGYVPSYPYYGGLEWLAGADSEAE